MKLNKIEDVTDNWKDIIKEERKKYRYQPKLTEMLDAHKGPFTEMTILEIVLWKVNRYPNVTPPLLAAIDDLRSNPSLEKGRKILEIVLDKEFRGFDLPMASTLLRFACPSIFQIIDQRVYRFITPGAEKLSLPHNPDRKIDLYFEYLKRLHETCHEYNIKFEEADRILYQLDKKYNKDISIHKAVKEEE